MTAGRPQWSPAFDPQLPLLSLAFDFASVGELFEHKYAGEHQSGNAAPVTIRKLQDLKYHPGRQCVATYELDVADGSKQPSRALGVLRIETTEAVVLLPREDPGLDRLGEALDPEAMRLRFQATPELGMLTGPPRIDALRYKPRLRCSLRYELDTVEGKQVVFGKMLAQDGERAMSVLNSLHTLSRELDTMPRIAAPLAYWPDMRLLLQQAVAEGDEFHSIVFDRGRSSDERCNWMRRAGERLGGLHSAQGPAGPSRAFEDDLEELSSYVAAIAAPDPVLARKFEGELERLRMADRNTSDLVPSHGAFRTDQFMVQGSELVLIDLDGFCWAEPARDIGNLFAYLAWRALRQPHQVDFVAPAREHFLSGYASVREPPQPTRVALFEAASRLKIGGRRYRSLSYLEWPLVPALIESSSSVL